MNPLSATGHFTAINDPDVEKIIANTLLQLRQDISRIADSESFSVYLGGGYGKGEGGVLITKDTRHLPCNDLDFFVFSQKASRRKCHFFNSELEKLGAAYTKKLGISMDFAPVKPMREFLHEQHTLMYQELLYNHLLISGPDILANVQCPSAHDISALEALGLLVNSGMGLLFSVQKLSKNPEAADGISFAVRHLHKAAQGVGDVLLMAQHRYDYNIERRLSIILYDARTQAILKEIAPLYKAAVEFKFLPASSTLDVFEKMPQYIRAWLDVSRHFVAFTTDRSPSILETTRQLADCIYGHPNFKGSPIKNAAQWILKTKNLSPVNLVFRHPTARLFARLHSILTDIHADIEDASPGEYYTQARPVDAAQNELADYWRMFKR